MKKNSIYWKRIFLHKMRKNMYIKMQFLSVLFEGFVL